MDMQDGGRSNSDDKDDGDDGDELETYLLLVLSDSALPTGGFVASSGLESFVAHGFLSSSTSSPFHLVSFLRASLVSYAHLNLVFFRRAHAAVWSLCDSDYAVAGVLEPAATEAEAEAEAEAEGEGESSTADQHALAQIIETDNELERMLLNHVSRRASKAQGIALLTLYSRAFAETLPPASSTASLKSGGQHTAKQRRRGARMTRLMDSLKTATRSKRSSMQGHLPICFAVLCAALGLSLARSMHLHLFLQARATLSSAVRLNLVGPYAAQRLLLSDVRPIVAEAIANWQRRLLSTGDASDHDDQDDDSGPATTWPLGEILAARHDQLHSRIFNS